MSYRVKYIGNCVKKNIDIEPLYCEDLKNGDKVILVCETKNSAQYFSDNILLIDNPIDASKTESNLMLLRTTGDAMKLAVDCASELYAEECQVYIKYDGIFTADPETSNYAQRIERIDYDEIGEMCIGGYNGLSYSMIEEAKKKSVVIRLLSYNEPQGKGTIVKEVMGIGSQIVKGIEKSLGICIVTLTSIPDVRGSSYKIFKTVSDAGIIVDIISLPANNTGHQDLSFTIKVDDKSKAEKVLKEHKEILGFSEIVINDKVAKISVVGAALQTTTGFATSLFKVMYENDINLKLVTTSEIKISIIVDKSDADKAIQKIHEVFIN